MVHNLEMPLALARRRVQADQGFTEQVGARPPAAEKIVARRTHGHIQQTALLVEGHRRPDVCVPRELPGILSPGFVAEFAGLRNSVETPYLSAGVGVEGAHVAWRIVPVYQAIANTVTEDYQIFVNHRREVWV